MQYVLFSLPSSHSIRPFYPPPGVPGAPDCGGGFHQIQGPAPGCCGGPGRGPCHGQAAAAGLCARHQVLGAQLYGQDTAAGGLPAETGEMWWRHGRGHRGEWLGLAVNCLLEKSCDVYKILGRHCGVEKCERCYSRASHMGLSALPSTVHALLT